MGSVAAWALRSCSAGKLRRWGVRAGRSLLTSTHPLARAAKVSTIGLLLPLVLGLVVEQPGSLLAAWLCDLSTGLLWGPVTDPMRVGPGSVTFVEANELPLNTSGRWIVDKHGRTVHLRCVNWYGAHLGSFVVGGLDQRPLHKLAFTIRALGFNCVRLPYSLELQLTHVVPSPMWLRANTALQNATALDVFDATVAALANAHLMIILNNHQGRAMWCCSEDDGEGLWYTTQYPEEVWLASLGSLAARYRSNPYVVGYDLRNEPRGVPAVDVFGGHTHPTWGEGGKDVDWAAAATRGGLAVAAQDPSALVFVEGLDFATDLSGVGVSEGSRAAAQPHMHPGLRGRVVYEVHDYCWYHGEFFWSWCLYWVCLGQALVLAWEALGCGLAYRGKLRGLAEFRTPRRIVMLASVIVCWCSSTWLASYWRFSQTSDEKWGYLLKAQEAPVWLGEFGTDGVWVTDDWGKEVGEAAWWRNLLRYMREHKVDYAYWALNGDKAGADESFGLLERDYTTVRYPWLLAELP